VKHWIGSNGAAGFAATRTAVADAVLQLLTSPELLDLTEAHLPEHRERCTRRP